MYGSSCFRFSGMSLPGAAGADERRGFAGGAVDCQVVEYDQVWPATNNNTYANANKYYY